MDRKNAASAIELLKAGKLTQAKDEFLDILAQHPLHPEALHYVGYLSIGQQAYSEGIGLMNLAAMLSPGNKTFAQNHLRAARNFETAGQPEYSVALLRGWQQANPDCALSANRLARSLLLCNQPEQAQRALAAADGDPSFDWHFYSAIAHKLLKQEAAARASLKRALTLMPLHDLSASQTDPVEKRKPSLLLVYATDYLPFTPVLKNDVAFSIEGGHFNAHAFASPKQYSLSRLFVSDSEAFRAASQDLAGFDLIINCISDPEVNSASLEMLDGALSNCSVPVFNLPATVLRTSRSKVHQQLRDLPGVISPPMHQIDLPASIEDALAALSARGLEPPLLLRPLGSSTGIGLALVDRSQPLRAAIKPRCGTKLNICPFNDFASPDGLYRKYRVFVIGGNIYPEHCVIFDHWNVHSSSRLKLMKDSPELRAEEKAFVDNFKNVLSPDHIAAIHAISDQISLDYFGIDFTIPNLREILVFEANAGMRINPDFLEGFPYLGPPIDRIIQACNSLVLKLAKAQ